MFISFQQKFPPICLFPPILLLVFEEISHLYFYSDSSSIRNSRVYKVSIFSALWMVFPESWKRRCPNFYAHYCSYVKNYQLFRKLTLCGCYTNRHVLVCDGINVVLQIVVATTQYCCTNRSFLRAEICTGTI